MALESYRIDAGARALREHDMHGRITRAWEVLPKSAKNKWLLKAQAVIDAADEADAAATPTISALE